ncbi:unnamed protein product, partial [Bemisia tabaci]
RVNSHAAGSSFFYTFCGVKDIFKRIVLNQAKRPITKIRFSKKTFEISKKRLLDETICKEKKFKRTCGDKFLHSTMR